MANIKSTKRQTMIYKTIQRKLKIEQHEPTKKHLGSGSVSCTVQSVAAALLLFKNTKIISYGNRVGRQYA